jgi:hypothetical protein
MRPHTSPVFAHFLSLFYSLPYLDETGDFLPSLAMLIKALQKETMFLRRPAPCVFSGTVGAPCAAALFLLGLGGPGRRRG